MTWRARIALVDDTSAAPHRCRSGLSKIVRITTGRSADLTVALSSAAMRHCDCVHSAGLGGAPQPLCCHAPFRAGGASFGNGREARRRLVTVGRVALRGALRQRLRREQQKQRQVSQG